MDEEDVEEGREEEEEGEGIDVTAMIDIPSLNQLVKYCRA